MSPPVCIDYDQRQIGDLVIVVTRDRIPIPNGWTDVSGNRDTNPHIQAYRTVVAGDRDVYQEWNLDPLNDPKAAGVMVFRGTSPVSLVISPAGSQVTLVAADNDSSLLHFYPT